METNGSSRATEASNSVIKSTAIGLPAATVLGYLQAIVAAKYKIPVEVVGAAFGLIIAGIMSGVQYFARGGRKGESS